MAKRPETQAARARKRQIAEVTLQLVGQYGVEGTTTARIAAGADVSEATLYRYFPNRKKMLVAALDLIYERIFEILSFSDEPDVIERIRQIISRHCELLCAKRDGFVYPFFEFVGALPEIGLREEIGTRQQTALKGLSALVNEGKAQGRIRPDVDSDQVAWELLGVFWSVDIASLIGLDQHVLDGRPSRELEQILSNISFKSSTEPSSQLYTLPSAARE